MSRKQNNVEELGKDPNGDAQFIIRCIESCKRPIHVRGPITKLIQQYNKLYPKHGDMRDYLYGLREKKCDEIYERCKQEYEKLREEKPELPER